MAFSAMVRRMLVSAPGDIIAADITVVNDAVQRWNATYGPSFASVVVPLHWAAHATAEFGDRPQAILNRQLVDDSDALLALFWHRVGSPTGTADSGTIEEIDKVRQQGKYVAVLRCRRPYPPDAVDVDQLQRLETFFARIRSECLFLTYESNADLARHVDAILAQLVTREQDSARVASARSKGGAELWPRVESSERVRTDTRGRVSTSRDWFLVISNSSDEPARDVRVEFHVADDGDAPALLHAEGPVDVLAPRTEIRFMLVMHMGVAGQANCSVSWEDSIGSHTNRATVRFY